MALKPYPLEPCIPVLLYLRVCVMGGGGGEGGGVRPERDKMHNTSCKFKPKLPPLPTRGYPVDKCHPSSTN